MNAIFDSQAGADRITNVFDGFGNLKPVPALRWGRRHRDQGLDGTKLGRWSPDFVEQELPGMGRAVK